MTLLIGILTLGALGIVALVIAVVVVLAAIGVLVYTLGFALWMLVAIFVESATEPGPRAVARDRWPNALRRSW